LAVIVALAVRVTVAAVALVALAIVACPAVTVRLTNLWPSGAVVVMAVAVFALMVLGVEYAVPPTFIVLLTLLGLRATVSVYVVG